MDWRKRWSFYNLIPQGLQGDFTEDAYADSYSRVHARHHDTRAMIPKIRDDQKK
jgi:hypothetical protein